MRVKDDFKGFGLNRLGSRAAIFYDESAMEGAGLGRDQKFCFEH